MVSWLQKISSGNESRTKGENDEKTVPNLIELEHPLKTLNKRTCKFKIDKKPTQSVV